MKKTLIIISFFFSSSTYCADVIQSHVTYKNKRYIASIEMIIDAPGDDVYDIFTNFNDLAQLSDNITQSRLLSRTAAVSVVEVKTHNCVLFFCKDLTQTQRVHELNDGKISVEDIKGKSDFIYAKTTWHIRQHDDETRVSFRTEMQPDFWLPPLLGPWLFKKRLIKETAAMLERIEELAIDDD